MLSLGCSDGEGQRGVAPGEAESTAAAGQAFYRSDAAGFEFGYPAVLDQPGSEMCRLVESDSGRTVAFGNSVSVRSEAASGRSLTEASEVFLRGILATAENSRQTTLGGAAALEVEYRVQGSARFGVVRFASHRGMIYALGFEARGPGCNGLQPAEIYSSIVSSFRFLR